MPTPKQLKAAKILVENGGNIGNAMRKAGYGRGTAKTPQKLTGSKGWQDIMREYFPDEYMAKKHRELFEKQEVVIKKDEEGKVEVIKTGEIDPNAVKAALDMGYKLTAKYAPERIQITARTLEGRIRKKATGED